jgi:hypothetical protein
MQESWQFDYPMPWLTTSSESLLDPDLGGDAQAINKGLVLHHIIGRAEIQLNHVEELISLGGDQHNTSPCPVDSKGIVEVHAPVLPSNRGKRLLCLGPFHHDVC